FQAEDGIRDRTVTGVQTCALPIWGCIKVLILQAIIVSLGLWGLGLTGVGVDEMRCAVDPSAKAPHWPLHIAPPASWSPMQAIARSEERRVGKEWSTGGGADAEREE